MRSKSEEKNSRCNPEQAVRPTLDWFRRQLNGKWFDKSSELFGAVCPASSATPQHGMQSTTISISSITDHQRVIPDSTHQTD
jgi:hypothetical protein